MLKAREILLYFSLLYEGDFSKIYQALRQKERIDHELFIELKSGLLANYCTIVDDDFPEQLKNIANPPLVLYYYGDFSLLEKPNLAVIGSRKATEYGIVQCREIVIEIVNKKDIVIISGLAKGIDGVAHRAAIDGGGKTVAVLVQELIIVIQKKIVSFTTF